MLAEGIKELTEASTEIRVLCRSAVLKHTLTDFYSSCIKIFPSLSTGNGGRYIQLISFLSYTRMNM